MAAHMEPDAIASLPITPYPMIRETLQSGDLLFTSGNYLISQAIQKVTGSPWSHVGIVFRLDGLDRVLLLESVEDVGVRFAPLSKYLNDYADGRAYQGRIVVARCEGVDAALVGGLARFGIDTLTRPYDNAEIAHILARVTLGLGKRHEDTSYICSELVYACFAHAGLVFHYDKRGFISPENIWVDERLGLVGRVL